MRGPLGVVAPPDLPMQDFIRYVQRAEDLGFDQLWVVEDCFFRGGVAQAAVALAKTDQIQIGMGILPAGARNPAFASIEIATLAGLFPDRLLVGVGHGMPRWMKQVGGWPASPLGLLAEYIPAVKAILQGESVSTEGRYVNLRDVRLESAPSSVPPVFAGVRGPKSLQISAAVADGTILAEPVTPEYLRAVRGQVKADLGNHRIVAYNVGVVDDSASRARSLARASLAWIGDPEWSPHIAPLPFAEEFVTLRARSASREQFASELPGAWVDQLAVVGTAERVASRLEELVAAGATDNVLIPAGADPYDSLASLAQAL